MPTVYAAVNALQNTAWGINQQVFEVMTNLYETGRPVAGVPASDNQPIPALPAFLPREKGVKMLREDMTPEQLTEFSRWKEEARAVHVANAEQRTKRAGFLRCLDVAYKLKDEAEFYYPHQLDWRGRAYPMPLYLQPQGSDIQRGLLQFAYGAPINDQIAADWLAIHGSACFGFDKADLEARVAWVREHEALILACASDPYSTHFWEEADSPWQFLAFCFDWAGFKAHGFGYESALPIQMDGTCNGLQNFSAMLLDEVGGAAVNLVPADRPQDIYGEVAKLVAAAVAQDIHSDEPITVKSEDAEGNKIERVL